MGGDGYGHNVWQQIPKLILNEVSYIDSRDFDRCEDGDGYFIKIQYDDRTERFCVTATAYERGSYQASMEEGRGTVIKVYIGVEKVWKNLCQAIPTGIAGR